MKYMMTKLLLAGLMSGALTVLTQSAAHAQLKIILSNDTNIVGTKGQTFNVLKDEIVKRLGDKVRVEVYHNGTLFDQKTQLQGVQLGSANMIAPTQGIYTQLAPKMAILSLPFILSTPKAMDAAMRDPVVRATFVPDLERKNITPVAIWLNGPRDLSYRGTKPILVPADMRGVKMRVQPIQVDIKTMEALGANVVTMAWTELLTGLQQGVVDGVELAPNSMVGGGLAEFITQMTKVGYQYSTYVVGVNKQWWDGLQPDVRAKVQDALNAATEWNWTNTDKENEAAYKKVESMGKKVHALTAEQRAEWVKAVQPIWVEYGDKLVGADVMKRLKEIGDANR